MSTATATPQLLLFPQPSARPASPRRRPARRPTARRGTERGSGRARMVARLEHLAEQAEREMRECRRAGDAVGARAARDRAAGARRAAQILSAGPDGVARIITDAHPSPHPEAA